MSGSFVSNTNSQTAAGSKAGLVGCELSFLRDHLPPAGDGHQVDRFAFRLLPMKEMVALQQFATGYPIFEAPVYIAVGGTNECFYGPEVRFFSDPQGTGQLVLGNPAGGRNLFEEQFASLGIRYEKWDSLTPWDAAFKRSLRPTQTKLMQVLLCDPDTLAPLFGADGQPVICLFNPSVTSYQKYGWERVFNELFEGKHSGVSCAAPDPYQGCVIVGERTTSGKGGKGGPPEYRCVGPAFQGQGYPLFPDPAWTEHVLTLIRPWTDMFPVLTEDRQTGILEATLNERSAAQAKATGQPAPGGMPATPGATGGGAAIPAAHQAPHALAQQTAVPPVAGGMPGMPPAQLPAGMPQVPQQPAVPQPPAQQPGVMYQQPAGGIQPERLVHPDGTPGGAPHPGVPADAHGIPMPPMNPQAPSVAPPMPGGVPPMPGGAPMQVPQQPVAGGTAADATIPAPPAVAPGQVMSAPPTPPPGPVATTPIPPMGAATPPPPVGLPVGPPNVALTQAPPAPPQPMAAPGVGSPGLPLPPQ